MGSPDDEPGRRDDEGPQHQVTVSSFYMGKYPVTIGEYKELSGYYELPNKIFFGDDNWPVMMVSWYDAVLYCNKRSLKEGLTPAYTVNKDQSDPDNTSKYDDLKWLVTWNREADGYRLPTEAEWEYACRAGTTTRYNTGDSITKDQANCQVFDEDGHIIHSGHKFVPVDSFAPNAWGLYDIHGNVFEWCWDWYGKYTDTAQTNPAGTPGGYSRVRRGGSWRHLAKDTRSAYRSKNNSSDRLEYIGFRLARSAV